MHSVDAAYDTKRRLASGAKWAGGGGGWGGGGGGVVVGSVVRGASGTLETILKRFLKTLPRFF